MPCRRQCFIYKGQRLSMTAEARDKQKVEPSQHLTKNVKSSNVLRVKAKFIREKMNLHNKNELSGESRERKKAFERRLKTKETLRKSNPFQIRAQIHWDFKCLSCSWDKEKSLWGELFNNST